jgi:phospholipid transport system substrate-binding protein
MDAKVVHQFNPSRYVNALLLLMASLLLASPPLHADSDVANQAPAVIIRDTISVIMTRLRTDAGQFQDNPQALHALVSDVVVPHLDIQRISRMVLGKASRRADKVAMAHFSDQFRLLLIRTYASSLSQFSGETIDLPIHEKQLENGKASVDMKIQRPGQATIDMNFRMHNKSGPWLVYDIKIEGISLIVNYRAEFSRIMREQGLEALIDLLKSKNGGVKLAVR